MPTVSSTSDKSSEDKAADAVTQANTDLDDQGDIAADDAGGTAAAHRVEEALGRTPPTPD